MRFMPGLTLASASAVLLLFVISPTDGAKAQTQISDRLFKQRCAVCHSNVAGKSSVGPSLFGVIGRRAGSASYPYTSAMKRSGLVWNTNNLDRFLTNPNMVVPGTRMTIATTSPAERAELIRYLGTLR